MTRYFLLFLIFLNLNCLAASSDNIELQSTVDPQCEMIFSPEPIASNLDLVNSASDLYIGRLNENTNTANVGGTIKSSLYQTDTTLDFGDHLSHATSSSYSFAFSNLKMIDEASNVTPSVPLGSPLVINDTATGHADLYLSYSGVPAINLVSGSYSVTWYASCSIEPRL